MKTYLPDVVRIVLGIIETVAAIVMFGFLVRH